jgi:hypothetical protein
MRLSKERRKEKGRKKKEYKKKNSTHAPPTPSLLSDSSSPIFPDPQHTLPQSSPNRIYVGESQKLDYRVSFGKIRDFFGLYLCHRSPDDSPCHFGTHFFEAQLSVVESFQFGDCDWIVIEFFEFF